MRVRKGEDEVRRITSEGDNRSLSFSFSVFLSLLSPSHTYSELKIALGQLNYVQYCYWGLRRLRKGICSTAGIDWMFFCSQDHQKLVSIPASTPNDHSQTSQGE